MNSLAPDRAIDGSSPRVRGTGRSRVRDSSSSRFIPACAGNGARRVLSLFKPPVHPRVCGERMRRDTKDPMRFGSSPRVRGTAQGSNPECAILRFIPACAGNGLLGRRSTSRGSVHPRVCGERYSRTLSASVATGSSPRVRGTEMMPPMCSSNHRFIPACAGNGARPSTTTAAAAVHPRVCGERTCHRRCRAPNCGSSPRVRGTVTTPVGRKTTRRFIPACAGNGRGCRVHSRNSPVHPRVCGERSRVGSIR